MGGHPESSFANLGQVGSFATGQLRVVFGSSAEGGGLGLLLAPFGIGAALLLVRRSVAPFRAGLWVPLTWLAGNFALSALSGVERDWYAYQVLAPLGLLAATVISAGLYTDPEKPTPSAQRAAGAALILGIAAALIMPVITAKPPEDRSAVDASARQTLQEVEQIVNAVPLGGLAQLQSWYPRVEAGSTSIFLHAPYSLDAYAELIGGPKSVFRRGNPPRKPDRITVKLTRPR